MSDGLQQLGVALADRYRFERELGAGGMATVYLVHDLRHDRKVALKILRPELALAIGPDRFHQEIRTTARLQHPHILPLHDSGDAAGLLFYTMPMVEGPTLRTRLVAEGRLPLDESIRLLREAAEALQYAHERGVIHRDVKPENLLLSGGHVLVADFGIALARTSGDGRLTEVGTSLGTPAYMSPEQATGDRELDHRTDQYALACVAYEMLAGQPPFTAGTAAALIARQVCDPVPPLTSFRPDAPRPVAAAIERALAKAPNDRFESIAAFAKALEARESTPAPRSLAVLPFGNLSPDPDDAFFADGLAEEIITDLSRVKELRVISINSARKLKGTDKDTRTIGRELGVRYVLEGTVRRAGDRLRVTSQLIEADTDSQIWAERFSGTMADAFEIQEQIARQIADALAVRFSGKEGSGRRPFKHPEAFELFVRARQGSNILDSQSIDAALDMINRALALERDHPELLALKGFALMMQQNLKGGAFDSFPEALACVERALAVDPECAAALANRALLWIRQPEVDYGPILRDLLRSRAVERAAWTSVMVGFFATSTGHLERATQLLRDDLDLDPFDPLIPMTWAFIHMFRPPAAAALDMSRAVIRRFPGQETPLFMHALMASAIGERKEAVEALGAVPGEGVFALFARALRHALLGENEEALAILSLPHVREAALVDDENCWIVARAYATIGSMDEAMWWLDRAAHRGWVDARFVSEIDQMLIPLRDHPGMPALLDFMRRRSAEIARDSGLLEATTS
jgi:serine/threonine-protein kinase